MEKHHSQWEDGVFLDGRRRKEVLSPQRKVRSPHDEWTVKEKYADHTPGSSRATFFHALSCLLELDHSVRSDEGEDPASLCDPALIILFIKCLFN